MNCCKNCGKTTRQTGKVLEAQGKADECQMSQGRARPSPRRGVDAGGAVVPAPQVRAVPVPSRVVVHYERKASGSPTFLATTARKINALRHSTKSVGRKALSAQHAAPVLLPVAYTKLFQCTCCKISDLPDRGYSNGEHQTATDNLLAGDLPADPGPERQHEVIYSTAWMLKYEFMEASPGVAWEARRP